MGIYKFIKEIDPDNEFDKSRVVIEVDTECRSDLLEYFEDFLKGCGYSVNGTIDIVGGE